MNDAEAVATDDVARAVGAEVFATVSCTDFGDPVTLPVGGGDGDGGAVGVTVAVSGRFVNLRCEGVDGAGETGDVWVGDTFKMRGGCVSVPDTIVPCLVVIFGTVLAVG
ncbi:MAG TPA: hypothetical protein VH681_05995 [Nitrospiraceae bacterium]